jgi:hypothetical protein
MLPSNLRIKFYSKWIENFLEQALNPDRMRTFGPIGDGPFWFRLVRVGGDQNLFFNERAERPCLF